MPEPTATEALQGNGSNVWPCTTDIPQVCFITTWNVWFTRLRGMLVFVGCGMGFGPLHGDRRGCVAALELVGDILMEECTAQVLRQS